MGLFRKKPITSKLDPSNLIIAQETHLLVANHPRSEVFTAPRWVA